MACQVLFVVCSDAGWGRKENRRMDGEKKMSTSEERTGSAKRVGLEKRFELAEGYVKTVLGLSTGALVLSVTFLHEIIGVGSAEAPNKIAWKSLIVGAWVALLVSAMAA